MDELSTAIDELAAEGDFSGVVRVDIDGATAVEKAYGFAHRGFRIPNRSTTRFATASTTKGLTALAVVSLVEEGVLGFHTTARSLLGDDLPLIDDRVTVQHLLAHRSGVGDYIDEDLDRDPVDYVMPFPVHELDDVEHYLPALAAHPQKFAPGTAFSYCNGGFAVLAILAQRASGTNFAELVDQRVCRPAGLSATSFTRSDELGGDTAVGYLHATGLRSNVLHLPVVGSGDGGIYSTTDDLHRLWAAFLAGAIVSPAMVTEMTRAHTPPSPNRGYGLGVWLPASGALMLQGYDAGVSCATVHDPAQRITHTVISNTTEGAWPLYRRLNELLGT